MPMMTIPSVAKPKNMSWIKFRELITSYNYMLVTKDVVLKTLEQGDGDLRPNRQTSQACFVVPTFRRHRF